MTYIAVGTQGHMQKHAFLGVYDDIEAAKQEATRWEEERSLPGIVLEAVGGSATREVFRSQRSAGRQETARQRRW